MTLENWYWLLYALLLVFGTWGWSRLPVEQRWPAVWPVLLYALLFIIGQKLFGSPVK